MKQLLKYLTAAAAMLIALCLPAAGTHAQAAPSIVGSWSLVSLTVQRSGNQLNLLGPRPQGQLIFGSDGRYVLMGIRADLPKLAEGSRLAGSTEENKIIAEGAVAHFGTYTVDEAGSAIVFHIQKSTFELGRRCSNTTVHARRGSAHLCHARFLWLWSRA